jgi:8-oxo-dGTP diphosphatase
MAKTFTYDYPRPAVCVDLVLISREASPRVLLIRRGRPPFQGAWALPGGFIEMDETLEESARRELKEETGLTVGKLEFLGIYDEPKRDPRGRVISAAFLAIVSPNLMPQAADDAEGADWFSLRRPPTLAFDHAAILSDARRRLKALVGR